MKQAISLLAVLSMGAVFAASTVTVTEVTSDAESRMVTVKYTLSGDPAIVTAEFFENGAAIPEAETANAVGDVNRYVEPTGAGEAHTILWSTDAISPPRTTLGQVSVALTAWTPDAPPDYLVFDLLDPTNLPYHAAKFYTSTNALPGGLGDIRYRQDFMVFRRIPAAGIVWMMGSPVDESGRSSEANRETRHRVKLTNDYFMAVFEATQGQCPYLFAGTTYVGKLTDNSLNNDGDPSYAQGKMCFGYLKTASTDAADKNLVIGRMRLRTGVAFDLPTEAQWEFACRAGTGTALYNNQNLNNNLTSPMERSLGWIYYANQGKADDGYAYGPRPVGRKLPNAWGLYDMYGNVAELCRDSDLVAYPADDAIHVDPLSDTSHYTPSGGHVLRGGYYNKGANDCRSAARLREGNAGAYLGYGFRLLAPIPLY